jgi:hypothetical protein
MTFKTKTKARFQSFLRRLGLLCKKPIETTKYIKVSKTIFPDGTEVKHHRITSVPKNQFAFESQLHIFNEIKNSVSK